MRGPRGELPRPVRDFFAALGLDPAKPGEQELFPAGWYELGQNFSLGFQTDCGLLPEEFPRPCFQMELNHQLPWLLEEKNPYC